MRIGFLGAGLNARTIARHLITGGHEVVLSNSGRSSLPDVSDLGPKASAGTKDDIAACPLIILATQWHDAETAVKGIVWNGQILIDATNAHIDVPPDISLEGVTRSRAALAARGKTSSEIIRDAAGPGARFVKSISNMPMAWINDFTKDKPRTVLFTSGDDLEAKRVVIDLLDSLGFAAIDLGSLATGGALHEVGAPLSGVDLHFIQRLR
jgi:predicted dinucleotide-binding enzyme